MGFIDGLQVMFGTRDAAQSGKDYSTMQRQEAAHSRMEQMKYENKELKKRLDDLEMQMAQKEEKVVVPEPQPQPQMKQEMAASREDIDQLIVGVTIQIQEMIDALDKQMEELDQRVSLQVRRIGESSEKQLAAFRLATEQLDQMQAHVEQIDEVKTATDGIADIAANTAQIASVKEATDQINDIRTSLLQLNEIKQALAEYGELKDALESLKADLLPAEELKELLTSMRSELAEKIHTEDVKCYRNIKGLMDEMGVKLEAVEISDTSLNKIKRQNTAMKVAAGFAVVDCLLMVAYFMYTLGVFHF